MEWRRQLGQTGMEISAIGFGSVKLGRDHGVKYPEPFTVPNTAEARTLLTKAHDLGVNLIDTAPAYGGSEERLGNLLQGQRQNWILCSKVGEEFDGRESHFDFSGKHTRASLERSLRRLRTDYLDVVLIHSDGNDDGILDDGEALQELQRARDEGLVRAIGMSTKTVSGGTRAAELCDVIMATYNPAYTDELPVLDCCSNLGVGVMLKKVFASGHLPAGHADPLAYSLNFALSHPATSTAIIGTINPDHLSANIQLAKTLCAEEPRGS